MPVIERQPHLAEQVLFVDGLSGTGKTMISPILTSFDRVEVHRVEQIYENVAIMWHLGILDKDTAIWFLRTYVDQACYHTMIGRETNFRWKDLTGVLSNPGGWRYIRRLFKPEGDSVLTRIGLERPIIHLITHQIVTPVLFQALGQRAKIVEMVRNPLHLIPHWYSYLDRFGTHPRDLSICLNHQGQPLPWFTSGWEDKFVASNKMDKVIFLLDTLVRIEQANLDALDETTSQQVLVIPFETFVLDPEPYLNRIGDLLDSKVTRLTRRTLRKEKVPRRVTTAGRDLPIYRRYAWRPPARQGGDSEDFRERWDAVAQEATPEAMKVLESMCATYSERYLNGAK